jgi:hypothetical protein
MLTQPNYKFYLGLHHFRFKPSAIGSSCLPLTWTMSVGRVPCSSAPYPPPPLRPYPNPAPPPTPFRVVPSPLISLNQHPVTSFNLPIPYILEFKVQTHFLLIVMYQ